MSDAVTWEALGVVITALLGGGAGFGAAKLSTAIKNKRNGKSDEFVSEKWCDAMRKVTNDNIVGVRTDIGKLDDRVGAVHRRIDDLITLLSKKASHNV